MHNSTPIDEFCRFPEANSIGRQESVASFVMGHPSVRDMQRLLLRQSDIPEIKALSRTCKNLSNLVNENALWQSIGDYLNYEVLDKEGIKFFFREFNKKFNCYSQLEKSTQNLKLENSLAEVFSQIVWNEEIYSENSAYRICKAKDSLQFWDAFAKDIQLEYCNLSRIHSFESLISTELELDTTYKLHAKLILKISKLNLMRFNMFFLPKEIAYFENLKELNLSSNYLSYLPKELSLLTNIEWLDLSNNKFVSEPREIYELTELQELNLSENKLTILNPQIRNLTKLHWLDLSRNEFKTLPSEITALTELKMFKLSDNQLTSIPFVMALSQLNWLYLAKNQLKELPGIEGLTQLINLDISYNHFKLMPPLYDLYNLKSLDLSFNPTYSLFEDIQALSWLDRIDLNRAQMLQLKPQLSSFRRPLQINFCDNFVPGKETWRLNFN